MTKAYHLTQSHGRAAVIERSPAHDLLEYRDLFQFLSTFEVGVIEEGVRACGYVPDVHLKLTSPSSGPIRSLWEGRLADARRPVSRRPAREGKRAQAAATRADVSFIGLDAQRQVVIAFVDNGTLRVLRR